jgi:hypothetical protein
VVNPVDCRYSQLHLKDGLNMRFGREQFGRMYLVNIPVQCTSSVNQSKESTEKYSKGIIKLNYMNKTRC